MTGCPRVQSLRTERTRGRGRGEVEDAEIIFETTILATPQQHGMLEVCLTECGSVSVTTIPMLLVASSIHSRANCIRVVAILASNLGGLVAHCNAYKHPDAFRVVIASCCQRFTSFELRIGGRMCVGNTFGQRNVIDENTRAAALALLGIGSKVPENDPNTYAETALHA